MSLSKIHLPPKSTGNTQEEVARPDMTEKLFTGTLNKNETKSERDYGGINLLLLGLYLE